MKNKLWIKILVPVLIVAVIGGIGFVQKINSSETYNKAAKVIKLLMGMVILLIGLYMFWLAF